MPYCCDAFLRQTWGTLTASQWPHPLRLVRMGLRHGAFYVINGTVTEMAPVWPGDKLCTFSTLGTLCNLQGHRGRGWWWSTWKRDVQKEMWIFIFRSCWRCIMSLTDSKGSNRRLQLNFLNKLLFKKKRNKINRSYKQQEMIIRSLRSDILHCCLSLTVWVSRVIKIASLTAALFTLSATLTVTLN